MNSLLPRCLPAGLLGLTFLLFAGCESGSDRRAMEEARRAIPPMGANEIYFDGKIAAHLTLGNGLDESVPGKGPGGKGSRAGRRTGGHRGMGGPRHGGAEGMSGEAGSDLGEQPAAESSEEVQPKYADSPMPPTMLRLRLENTSSEAVTVEITDLDSELGNFATRPDHFILEPGAIGEPGAMQSLLGLESLALPVKLTLRVGGKAESKTLTLRPVAPEPAKPAVSAE